MIIRKDLFPKNFISRKLFPGCVAEERVVSWLNPKGLPGTVS